MKPSSGVPSRSSSGSGASIAPVGGCRGTHAASRGVWAFSVSPPTTIAAVGWTKLFAPQSGSLESTAKSHERKSLASCRHDTRVDAERLTRTATDARVRPAFPVAMAPATALGAARSSFVASAGAFLGAGRRAPRAGRSPETRHRGPVRVRAAGAFIKLIEIPAARGIAKGLMIPARKFMDGASGEENVLSSIAVRVPNEQPCVPFETAPLLPLSGYDVGEVPFVMQAVCYYERTLDVEALGDALAQTLVAYPLLAGRLDLANPDARRKGVRLTNDGCPLRCVTSDATFERLPDDYADASRRFLDYEPWIDIMLGGAPAVHGEGDAVRGGRERPWGLHVARGERRAGLHRVPRGVGGARAGPRPPDGTAGVRSRAPSAAAGDGPGRDDGDAQKRGLRERGPHADAGKGARRGQSAGAGLPAVPTRKPPDGARLERKPGAHRATRRRRRVAERSALRARLAGVGPAARAGRGRVSAKRHGAGARHRGHRARREERFAGHVFRQRQRRRVHGAPRNRRRKPAHGETGARRD